MKNIKNMKKGIDITIISLVLISILLIITITVKKSPDIFCHFISWLGVCEEIEDTAVKK